MLISNIEAQVRTRTGVSTSQYSQAQFLLDINEAKDEFWSIVSTRLEDDRNYDIWKVDNTTTISEYQIPEVAFDTAGAKLLKGIAIDYTGDIYTETGLQQYVPAREVNPHTMEHEWNYYVEHQSENDPIYYVGDNSYFIAPAFRTANLTNRIKLTGIRKIPDYNMSTTEAGLKIPVDFQRLLIWAVIPFALMAKRAENNDIQKAQNDYEQKKAVAIQNLAARVEGPITMLYPDQQQEDDIIITT